VVNHQFMPWNLVKTFMLPFYFNAMIYKFFAYSGKKSTMKFGEMLPILRLK